MTSDYYNHNLFTNRGIHRKIHKLPDHVIIWIESREEVLELAYDTLTNVFGNHPSIFDMADYTSFCACVARMSSIDSPKTPIGRTGGRILVHDILNADKTINTDVILKSIITDPEQPASMAFYDQKSSYKQIT